MGYQECTEAEAASRLLDRSFTNRDGLKLHYRDYAGSPGRPPLLCLHGLTRNSRDFEDVAQRYAGEWRVLALDFRGRGLSDPDPQSDRYAPPTYALDVLELLDHAGADRAVFLGTSLGGLVTMAVATMAPQRIAGAMLNDVGPELSDVGLDRIKTYVGKQVRFHDWDDAAAQLQARHGAVHPAYGPDEWMRYARRVCRQGADGVEFDYDMAIADPFTSGETGVVADAWPFFRALAGVPLLIIRGERSDLLPPAAAEAMRDALPDSELVTVPNVGHAPDLSEPEAVAGIDRLLERVLRRQA
jgi:pimeloyl-ACP methyl ester carboxylesterase